MKAILDFLLIENVFFGLAVQNWLLLVVGGGFISIVIALGRGQRSS